MRNTGNILLLEDNASEAMLTTRALKKLNIENKVIHLPNGKVALDYLYAREEFANRQPEEVPAMILIDLKMPVMDGLTFLKALSSFPKSAFLNSIVLTSSSEEEEVRAALLAGAKCFVRKPVNYEEFIRSMQLITDFWLNANINSSMLI